MADFLNSNGLRVSVYALAALACLFAGFRERHSADVAGLNLWPRFWTLSAVVLAAMAFARATDIAEILTEFGRSEARSSGWYEARRPLQAAIVGALSAGWSIAVLTAIWRVPERRRRYLPEAIGVFSLICFAAVRAVSFHYADAILYNNPILGVRIGSIIELAGTSMALTAAAVRVHDPVGRWRAASRAPV